MDKRSKQERRRHYNKQWIAAKRKKILHLSSTAEQNVDSSDECSRKDHSNAQAGNHDDDLMKAIIDSSDECSGKEHPNAQAGNRDRMTGILERFDSNARDTTRNEHSGTEHSFTDSDNDTAVIVSSEDISSEESEENTESFTESLRQWANTYEIKSNAVDGLLKILKENGHAYVPQSARTLLKTPRTVEILRVSDMDYYYFGLERMLCVTLEKYQEEDLQRIDTIFLSLNIDGLPLFKSTNCSVWPVLGAITNMKPLKPFPITVTVGRSKPSNLEFLEEMITELRILLADGLDFKGKHLEIKLKCIICDAPARSFVKCTKQYSGYYGCDKCTQPGHYIGRVTYPAINDLVLRTDESFRNKEQREHHKGESPFLQLVVDMVKDFPIDYMHQVCLGVTKKLILRWMRGPRGNTRLSDGQITQITTKLLSLKEFIPREFARKPRGLEDIDRWKATELRQFLLYTGQFALKEILPENLYRHFMSLCVAINILVSESLVSQHANYAQRLLVYFVSQCRELYGEEFLVYNVHSLLHLKEETDYFGTLDECAAWPFESYMQQLKRKVRGGNNPAVQLVKRIQESIDIKPVSDNIQKICHKYPNNMYRTENGKFCELIHPANADKTLFLCRVYHTPELCFTQPCNSDLIGHVQFRYLNYEIQRVDAQKLVTKCIRILLEDNRVAFLPLQHDYY